MPSLNLSPTSRAKTLARWLNNGCILNSRGWMWGWSIYFSWKIKLSTALLPSSFHFGFSKCPECSKESKEVIFKALIFSSMFLYGCGVINSLCAQLFRFPAAVSGYLHLLWVFNVWCPETRAPWWSSLAALPSTGRGMCWSWRSVRTTHHLGPRNMWWALRCRVQNERACLCPGLKGKYENENNRLNFFSGNSSFIVWSTAQTWSCFSLLYAKKLWMNVFIKLMFLFFFFNRVNHIFQSGLFSLRVPSRWQCRSSTAPSSTRCRSRRTASNTTSRVTPKAGGKHSGPTWFITPHVLGLLLSPRGL